MIKSPKIKKFNKSDIPHLRYAMIHTQFGHNDGVSIVMKQIEQVMIKYMKIPKKNIFYLVGKAKQKSLQIKEQKILWDKNETNQLMLKYYDAGYSEDISKKIERTITEAKLSIEKFIKKNKIDVIIAHNSCHPINFIMSIALSRYYKDTIKNNKNTPKYILWWHDSHLEREEFLHPAYDVEQYLLEGVPGIYVEYIIFINSMQFNEVKNHFLKLDKKNPGFYEAMNKNHNVMHNTTDTFIDSYDDLESDKFSNKVEKFIEDFKIRKLLKEKNLTLSEVLFCLQHTRVIDRKKIDFALKFCFELLKQKMDTKALYFLVSGPNGDNTKKDLIKLHKKLCKEYKISNFFLVFAEDYYEKTEIKFKEYPIIFAKLGGFTTYFSEVEGFGNNLLEVLASGLIPVIYTYPVFLSDIAKCNLKVISLEKFQVKQDIINKTLDILRDNNKKRDWVNKNLSILRRNFTHKFIASKVEKAVISRRIHI